MSNSQERSESKSESHADSHTETHESPIKTPKQLAVVILVSFLVPVILLIMLAQMVSFGVSGSSGSDALGAEATAKRISPVASYEFVDANAPRVFQTGEQIYQQVCAACHSAGVAGAPKVGDNAAWKPLIDSGLDEMVKIAIAGKGAMPPKGGNPALSDFEITRAVVLMANKSGGSFDEPEAPAEGEAQSATAAAPAAGAAPAAPAAPAQASAALAKSGENKQAEGAATANANQAPANGAAPAAAAAPAAQAAVVNAAGEKLYKTTCVACHAAGVAGAPKFGDKAAWAPYIATGEDEMVAVVLRGKGAMPPKGGAMTASEDDIRAAVQYMAQAAK